MMKGLLVVALALVPATGYSPFVGGGWRPAVRYSGVSLAPTTNSRRVVVAAAEGEAKEEVTEEVEEEAKEEAKVEAKEEAKDDITNSPVFLSKKIEVLEKEVAELDEALEAQGAARDAEWAEWGEQIERMQSEFDNIKRRIAKEQNSADSAERAQILGEIFPATDNFDRAKQYTKPNGDDETRVFEKYVTTVGAKLDEAFELLGVVAIDERGAPFDPLVHAAAMYQPSPDYPLDTISEILEKGYKIGDTLVRPATVIVSSGPQ
mmetsp:Transcript_10813/g.34577  ORF Transcript_10813/g.34577 Transcript_10813/m.34577 type:complete len:263 (+) Transcript_10813:62-850(+)